MNRIALIGLLAFAAACDLPLVMVEIEVPEVCVTRRVEIDATSITLPIAYVDGALPSQLGLDLSGSLGTTVDIKDNFIDLPAAAKDLLELDIQIKSIQLTAIDDPLTLEDESLRLDDVTKLLIQIVGATGSGLGPKTILAYDRAVAGTPSGGTIVATGESLNLAEYLYSGQVLFNYELGVTLQPGKYSFDTTACIATRGYATASINDIKGF
jgi:hypothetical protein